VSKQKKGSSIEAPLSSFIEEMAAGKINNTVFIRYGTLPPLYVHLSILCRLKYSHLLRPELRAPPPLTPQGEPVKPEAEKPFLQKYWMYILAVVIALCALFQLNYFIQQLEIMACSDGWWPSGRRAKEIAHLAGDIYPQPFNLSDRQHIRQSIYLCALPSIYHLPRCCGTTS
jgi:hypothetical protein